MHKLFNDDNLLTIVFKVITVVSVIYAIIQDLFYNLEYAIKFFKAEQEFMDFFDPCEKNVKGIQNFLLNHAAELFSGSIVVRSRSRNGNIKRHGTKGVFSLKNLPNLIFKMDTVFNGKRRSNLKRSLGMSVDKRYENIANVQKVCEENQFLHLKIPKSVKFEITPTNAAVAKSRRFRILAQQMFTPLKNGSEDLKIRDADLPDEVIKELAVFILKTGFFDVDDRNFLIIKEENGLKKIAVIDYEYVDLNCLDKAFYGGSIDGIRQATIQGLFNILPGKTDFLNKILRENKREDLIRKS